jgi:hypothetical protein
LHAELVRLLPRLEAAFPRSDYLKNRTATVEVFGDALDGVPLRAVAPAVDRAVRDSRYWPAPAVLKGYAWDAEREMQAQEAPARPARDPRAGELTCGQPGCDCRVRYFARPGSAPRLVPEHEAAAAGLVRWTRESTVTPPPARGAGAREIPAQAWLSDAAPLRALLPGGRADA